MEDIEDFLVQAKQIRDSLWLAQDAARDAKERHEEDTDVGDAVDALEDAHGELRDLVQSMEGALSCEGGAGAALAQLLRLLGLTQREYELMKNGLACRTPAEFMRTQGLTA